MIAPGSVTTWAGVQMLAIMLAVSGLPIWAHHPYPRTSLALNELMAVQMIASTLLCPILAATWGTILVNIAVGLAFTELAGLLGNDPQAAVINVWLFVSLWEFGLCGLVRQLKQGGKIYVVCIAILVVGGGVLIQYLRLEQATSQGEVALNWAWVGPLDCPSPNVHVAGWVECSIPTFLCAIVALTSSRKRIKM
jgi:hypothetical protein